MDTFHCPSIQSKFSNNNHTKHEILCSFFCSTQFVLFPFEI